MRSVGRYREVHLERQKSADAVPPRRDAYLGHTQQISYTEILQLEVLPSDPIQNPDGSFVYMNGYDR
jgi:hypothetical protein